MSMVCPQCKQNHDQLLECPQCKVRLLYQAPTLQPAPATPREDREGGEGQWQQTPWAKLVAGLLLAQGLYYGFYNLTLAGLSLGGDGAESVWRTLGGLVLSHGLQAIGLVIGGALAGAGQRNGAWYGCALGLANGVITMFVQRRELQAAAPLQVLVYALPLLHMAVGSLGGLIGAMIWRPTPLLPALDVTPVPGSGTSLFSTHLLSGPIHFWRICVGVLVVVVGVGWSSAILQSVLEFSGGALNITSHLQAKLVSWEIAALAALLGSGFAGANTFNGFKQGLFVGIGASVIVGTLQMAGPKFAPETLMLTVGGIVLLTVAGGWFGCQLFPPVLQGRRRLSTYF